MNRIKVESGEYKISDIKVDQSLYTTNLDWDIAFTLYSETLQKVALARNLNDQQCVKLFQEINKNNLVDDSLFTLTMVGGDNSAKSEQYCDHLMKVFFAIENGIDILNLVGYDVNHKVHPNSMEISCLNGILSALS